MINKIGAVICAVASLVCLVSDKVDNAILLALLAILNILVTIEGKL